MYVDDAGEAAQWLSRLNVKQCARICTGILFCMFSHLAEEGFSQAMTSAVGRKGAGFVHKSRLEQIKTRKTAHADVLENQMGCRFKMKP